MTSVIQSRKASQPPLLEGSGVLAVLAFVMLFWVGSLDGLSLGWDSLNHHFYLGWMAAEGSRLQQDIFAAGSMSCQYPFAYAPLYWLEVNGASGRVAALVLALPAVMTVPAVWLISWSLLPRPGIEAGLIRFLFTAMAFISPLWWSLLDSTSNDILSSMPMIWAFSLIIWRSACDSDAVPDTNAMAHSLAWTALSGAMAALSLVMKISHIFGLLGLLVLTITSSKGIRPMLFRMCALAVGGGIIAGTVWWPWAHQTWKDCGSPFYPMFTDWLRPFVENKP